MATVFGTHSPGRSLKRGPLRSTSIHGVNETVYIATDGLIQPSNTNMGIWLQAETAAVDVWFSLADILTNDTAPDTAAAALPWANKVTVAAGTIVPANPTVANWLKIVFTGAATIHIGSL